MRFSIQHITSYSYSEPASLGQNLAHLMPRTSSYQTCKLHQLDVRPRPLVLRTRHDFFGNACSYFSVDEPHSELVVTSTSEVTTHEQTLPNLSTTPPWDSVAAQTLAAQDVESMAAVQFAFASSFVPHLAAAADYARPSFSPGRPLLEAARDLTTRIHRDFKYEPLSTTINTPISTVLAERRGVCQDFAHLQLSCLRSLGLAARYVSGYLLTTPPPGKPRLIGADASHAWISVYCPHIGWIDFDPTNDQIPGQLHITVAWGRDFADVVPLQGVYIGGGKATLEVRVTVLPAEDLM